MFLYSVNAVMPTKFDCVKRQCFTVNEQVRLMLHMHSRALCTQKQKHSSVVKSFCDMNILTEHAAQKTYKQTHTT